MRVVVVLLALVCLADAASAQVIYPAPPYQPAYPAPGQYVQPGYPVVPQFAPVYYPPAGGCPSGGCPTVCPPGGCPTCPGCPPRQPIYLPRVYHGGCPGGCPRR